MVLDNFWKIFQIRKIAIRTNRNTFFDYWPQLRRAPIKFGRFIKLNNINIKVLYKKANIGFAAEEFVLGGGEGGVFPKKWV